MMQVQVKLPDFSVHHPADAGNDVTLVLLHGAFGAKEYWREQIRTFTGAGYRVLAWDAPGYGLSALPRALTVDHCARALRLLLEKEGGACNVVLGHSMGGMIAQQAWRYAREYIHGYVLSATSASFGSADGEWQKEFVRVRVAPLDGGRYRLQNCFARQAMSTTMRTGRPGCPRARTRAARTASRAGPGALAGSAS